MFYDGTPLDSEALLTTNPASVGDLQADPEIQNIIDETGAETFIMINSETAPFDDIRARQALAFATARESFISLVGLGIER